MNQQTIRNLTLFDLLARSWKRPSPIADVRFSADGTAVAFSGTDGSIAIAPTTDAEPPEQRIRVSVDLGQTTIRPRKNPPAPITAAAIRNDGDAPLAAFRKTGFVCGDTTGAVLGLTCTGEVEETLFRTEAGPVIAVDHSGQTGITIATDGDHLYLSRASGDKTRYGRGPGSHIEALAISPDGSQVAASFADGLSIWNLDGATAALHEIALPSRPHCLQWKADGKALACSLEGGGFGLVDLQRGCVERFPDFPASVRSLSWSNPADAFVASGAFRIAAWSSHASQKGEDRAALVTGRAGLVLVDAVAAHPRKALVAAGYANGQIVVAEIGARDEMLVRSAGGVVTALAWSADGAHLALGDASGTAAIVTFPHQMFK
jgi:WD40 repeat protein